MMTATNCRRVRSARCASAASPISAATGRTRKRPKAWPLPDNGFFHAPAIWAISTRTNNLFIGRTAKKDNHHPRRWARIISVHPKSKTPDFIGRMTANGECFGLLALPDERFPCEVPGCGGTRMRGRTMTGHHTGGEFARPYLLEPAIRAPSRRLPNGTADLDHTRRRCPGSAPQKIDKRSVKIALCRCGRWRPDPPDLFARHLHARHRLATR